VIDFDAVQARVPPIAIAPLRVRLGPGVHALVGGKEDGVGIVLALVAGSIAPRAGAVRVDGGAAGSRHARAAVAHVPLDAALPEPLDVDEAFAVARAIRGGPAESAHERLGHFGLAPLARRPIRTLSPGERRAVAFACALTSGARVLLLEEPLASVDPRASAAIEQAIRERGRAGACVLVATASVRDARTLADDVLVFDRGRLVRHAPATDPLPLAGPGGAVVHVVVSDPARLAAALAGETSVASVAVEPRGVVVRGADAVAIARAVAVAAMGADLVVESLRPELLDRTALHAAARGEAAAAYRAAHERPREAPAS
jgi:ABC-type multidrug transport system ATPase subunit